MKICVLSDNNTLIGNDNFCGEPGMSYYIEDDDKKIIFDTGLSDLFIKNAKVLGLDLSQVETIVFSHGHNDHTDGLRYLYNTVNMDNIKVIAHNNTFMPKYKLNGEYIGSSMLKDEIEQTSKLELSNISVKISPNIFFLGEIPRIIEFEEKKILGTFINNDVVENDYMADDTALVYKNNEGIFIITGCSHSGICNIIEYAKKVTQCENIIGVIGGFHLFNDDERTRKTIEYLKKANIDKLYPCHCVSLLVKCKMMNELNTYEVGVGTTIII